MVNVREDLTGKTFGKLTVIRQVEDYVKPNGKHEAQWLCKCSCKEQSEVIVLGQNLKKKNGTCSCGCIKKELLSQFAKQQRKSNIYTLNLEDEHGLYGIGYCSNTNNEFYFDMEDYDKVKNYCWYEHIDKSYHRLLARDCDADTVVKMSFVLGFFNHDHVDRNPLNNRKYNLRPATVMENAQNRSLRTDNTSGIVGVYFNQNANKWQSYIMVDKKQIYLGLHDDKEDAIIARLKAEKEYFGEFAPQKHLYEKYL